VYLVDTNVLSEVVKRAPHPGVLAWLARQSAVKVSVVSVFELEYGIARAPPARRPLLVEWLEGLLASPAHQFVPLNVGVARAAGELRRRAEEAGRPRPLADLLIAATALTEGAVVVTRNVADFEGLGVPLLDPFG
jgi:predicted nucleic acid-binding protein